MELQRKFLIVGTLLCFLVGSIFIVFNNPQVTGEIAQPQSQKILSDLTPYSAIIIANDSAFAAWPGSGTESDPYRIEDLNISVDGNCIQIENTSSHFRIRNCYLSSQTEIPFSYDALSEIIGDGIILKNTQHGLIDNCSFVLKNDGVSFYNSTGVRITDSIFRQCGNGISGLRIDDSIIDSVHIFDVSHGMGIYHAINVTFSNITLHDTLFSGLMIGGTCTDSIISNSTIFRTQQLDSGMSGAISLGLSQNITIKNNIIRDNPIGVYVDWQSEHCRIINNQIYDNLRAIDIWLASDIIIEENHIRDGMFAIEIWESESISVLNNEFGSFLYRGIALRLSTACNIIGNTMIDSGIHIEGVSPSQWIHTIENNQVNGRDIEYYHGVSNATLETEDSGQIFLVNCYNVTIANGVFSDVTKGISIVYSEDCIVDNCSIYNNIQTGVFAFYSEGITITNCRIHHNGNLYDQSAGIQLALTNGTTITRNLIYLNNGTGISFMYYGLSGSTYCLIHNNLISNNTRFGILLSGGSNDIVVYGNAIGWNVEGNARDDGTDNLWDDGVSQGNWWSDYLGNETYIIPGDAESADNYPLLYTSTTLVLPIGDNLSIELILGAIVIIGAIVVVILIVQKKKN